MSEAPDVIGIDFEAEGLLDGVDDERARRARVKLLEYLLADGVTLDELRNAVKEDRLVFLPVERALGDEPRYTLEELTALSGISRDFAEEHLRVAGRPRPAPDEPAFTTQDVDTAKRAKILLDAGLSRDGLLEVARLVHHGMDRAAEAVRTLYAESFLRPDDNEYDLALRYAETAKQLAPLMGPLLEAALIVHVREGLRSDVVSGSELISGRIAGARDITVCFADLVGFTRLSARLSISELGDVTRRFNELVDEHTQGPARLVKTMGDGVMLVSLSGVTPLIDSALQLVDAADREGGEFPQLRAGMAHGPALNRSGDWYGQVVNVASRVSKIARPGSVLTTESVRDSARDRYRWSFAGRFRLKGVKGNVPLYRVRADGDAT